VIVDCVANHSIFLRSNGNVVCWCDYGSQKVLQPYSASIDYAKDVYLGPVFSYIRENLGADRQPFPSFCSKCLVLAPEYEYNDYYRQERLVDTFQVEPSFACQLDCPGCVPLHARKQRLPKTEHGQMILDAAVLEKILTDLAQGGVRIRKIDFQGHGEPTLHPDVWNLVAMAKRLHPGSLVTMCTNAHKVFKDDMAAAGLDEILFAIDGMDQASYAPYRVYGEFDLAYKFMQDFSHAAGAQGKKTRTVWKYVLFDHNDSDEQLLRAQALAHQAGVTELRFVITQLGPSSTRIADESQIPRINLPVSVHVDNYKVKLEQLSEGMRLTERLLRDGRQKAAVDSALFVTNMLTRNLTSARTIPAPYRPIFDDLERVAESLPEKDGTFVAKELSRLRATIPWNEARH
jgi:wyosine [tRNA(Phe)-imidazoG37] synthetase (radical SAM superfamily)